MNKIDDNVLNIDFNEEKDKLVQGVSPDKKLLFNQISRILDKGTATSLSQVEIFNIFQSFFREDGGYIDFLRSAPTNGKFYLDKLYSFKEHGRTHIDGANKIPVVNSLKDFKDGHPGLMSANQAKFLENMGFVEAVEVKSGEGSTSTLDAIKASSPDYMIKMHYKAYIGASDKEGSPQFNDETNIWKPTDVEPRGLTVAGSTKVAQIADSYLKVGSLTTFYQNGDAVIGDSLTVKGKVSLDSTSDLIAKGNIKTQKCFVTLDASTGNEEIINICENRIINETIGDYKDLYFYVGDKSYNSGTDSKPTMIMSYDSTTKTGKVAINTTTPPTASSPEFSVAGSSSLGISGYSASTLQIFGSYIQIQSPTAVSLKNIPLSGYSATSMDISSYGGLTLQGDITMPTNKEVTVGSTVKKIGMDLYGSLHLSSPETNQFPIGFYSNLPADSTSPTTSLLGVPFSVRYDGKFGIRTLPGDHTMRVMGSAEFLSETGSSSSYDNIIYISELQNPGSPFNSEYDTTIENYGNNGRLVVKGTNIARHFESGPNYDIHLTGGKSTRYNMDGSAGIFHGVKIDGKVDIGTAGVDPKENLTLYNGGLIFPATNLDAKIDILGAGNITLNSGDVTLSGGDLKIGSTYGFNKEGIITAEQLHLGLVIDTSTGSALNTYTRYGFFDEGLTNVGDLYVYGDFMPQNITNIDLGGGLLTSVHDIEGEKAPTVDSVSAWSDTFKDGFFGEIRDYKSIKGSGEWGYITGTNPDTSQPYHEAQPTANGGSARPYGNWSNISNFHNIYSATPLLREYGYRAIRPVFGQEDRLVGKLSGFKYLLAGNKSVSEDAGDNPAPYIRGFANIYGLFSDSESEESLDKGWDTTNAGDIKYFKNIVGFDTNPNKTSIDLLIDDTDNEGQKIKNPLYPTYSGGSLQFFKEIIGLTDSVHRGGIERYSHIDLSYWDETLQRTITTAKFSKTDSDIFNSLLIVGDPTTKLDPYSGLIFKGGDNLGLIQKDVTLNWDSVGNYFSFHFTDSETTPSSPDKTETAVNHIDWATVKVGTLWVKGEELTAPVSVINNLNTNGILFTDGSNKMLGHLNVNRNNVNDVTIAYVDEIRITPDPNPFHLDIAENNDPTTLNIYSHQGYVDPDYPTRPLLIAPEDNSYLVLGEDNKGTGVIIGKSDTTLSKIIAGWDTTSSASLALYYRDTSGGVKQGLKLEEDGDVKINFGDVIVPSTKSVKIGTATILDATSLTVGTTAEFANTGITVSGDFAITAGSTVAFKILSSNGNVGVGDWSTGTISNVLDVKGTFQASGNSTIGDDLTVKGVTYLGDPNDHQLTISQESYTLDSAVKKWMKLEAPDTDKRMLLSTTPEGFIHMTTSEFAIGKAYPPHDSQGVGETGRFAWETDTLTVTGTEGNNTATGEYFSIGVNPNTGNTPNATNSAITLDEFNAKNKTFLRLFSDTNQWHNTHKYFKPSLVIGKSNEYWDTTSSSWKTEDTVPFYEYTTSLQKTPDNWILWTRYLDTITSGSGTSASQDDSVDATKFTFFIEVPSGYTTADEIFKVGYYISNISVDSSTDSTTRYYITKIKDLTTSGNSNDSNRKGFQIFTIPIDDTKVPDKDDYTNPSGNWQYRAVEFPTVTVNGVLKADNIGTAKLDATSMQVEKICWVPPDLNTPEGCIYIANDPNDSNKKKWFFDVGNSTDLGDVVFTGKDSNSTNYSWTAQEKLYGYSGSQPGAWSGAFGDYFNARNTILELRNLSDSDMGGKKPELVMSVSPSGVQHNDTDAPIKGIDFFELKTDQTEIDTRENPFDDGEDLKQYGKNAIMSLYRHNRHSGTAQTLLADYTTGNDIRQEYFRIDAREYYYEGSGVGGYDATITSKAYDSFIKGTFDVRDHLVNPSNTTPPTASNLLGFKLAGTLVEASATELNYLSGVNAGTNIASKALVVGSGKELDYLKLTGDAYLPAVNNTDHGTYLGATLLTATGAEINVLDGVTASTFEINYLNLGASFAGLLVADKVAVVNSNKYIDEWHIGDATLDNANSFRNVEKHRLDIIQTDDDATNIKYDFQIKVDSDTSPATFSDLTIQSQEHLYLKTQPNNVNYNVNGNIYIQPDKSIYFQSTNSTPTNGHYLFGTKKTGNFVSIGGDFASEETDIVYAHSTPTTVLYTNVDPEISGVTVDVVSNKKTIVLGFLTTSTIVPNDSDYIRLSIEGSPSIMRIAENGVTSISSGGEATVPNITGYTGTSRNWYKITLTEDISDAVLVPGGVWGDTTAVPKALNQEFGVIPGNSSLDQKSLYETHLSNNPGEPYAENPYLYRSTENVMLSRVDIESSSGIDYADLFDNLIADSEWITTSGQGDDYKRNKVKTGGAYLIGIRSYWENYDGDKYDGSATEPSGSYSQGNSVTILVENDYFWAGKPSNIHDWHQVESSNFTYIGQHTVKSQSYDWYFVEIDECGLDGVYGQLGNVKEYRTGSGFTFVDVTATGSFLETPDQALTLQGVMSMVGIDPVYKSPYESSDTTHYYSEANSTTGYLQNPSPINNRGHLWFDQDTDSLQFSIKNDKLWSSEPLFTPGTKNETELNDLSIIAVDSDQVAVDTEIIVQAVVVSENESATNKFKWKKTTDTSWSADVDMVLQGSPYSLSGVTGVSIYWDSLTGHGNGSQWRFRKGNTKSLNLSSSAEAQLWEKVSDAEDIFMRKGNVGIFKTGAGVPDPIESLHIAHTTGNLLLQYPNDTSYTWSDTDSPDLIIKEASSSDTKSITLGLADESPYQPRLEIKNDHFRIDTLDAKNLYLQQSTLAGKLIIGSTTDLGTKVSINDDVTIQKELGTALLTVKNTSGTAGTEVILADDSNNPIEAIIKDTYTGGVSLVQPSETYDNTAYDTDPSYYTGEKILNIHSNVGTTNTYMVLKRTPAFSDDNDSKGALGLGTPTPYKRLHVKDGNVLIENSEPVLSLGTPDLIYKSGTQGYGAGTYYYGETFHNKDARLNFSAGDKITAHNATQPTWNHGGKLDIVYRRGYDKITTPSYTDADNVAQSGTAGHTFEDKNLFEITTTTYNNNGTFPNDLQADSPKTRFVIDGETGNVGIGGSFERYPARERIHPDYKLDVEGGMRLAINFNSLSGFNALTNTANGGGYLNDYKYTYDTLTDSTIGTKADFVITKEIVSSVERTGTEPDPDVRPYRHTMDHINANTYPYAYGNDSEHPSFTSLDDISKMDYLATVQISGRGVSYFAGGDLGIGKYFEDTRNVAGRKPTSILHVKDFAFTEVVETATWYDATTEDGTVADANKFVESTSVLMATFEDVEKTSGNYDSVTNLTQQLGKWSDLEAGGKLNIYTKTTALDKENLMISSENTRDGLLLDATGTNTNYQLYLQKDGDVGIGQTFSFIDNVSSAITKKNILKRVSGVGTGSNLNGLEVKYQSTTNPQLFLLDNNKVVINKYDPDSTSTSGQFYLYDSDDNVSLAFVSSTQATLTYGDSNITSYTVPDEDDTLKFDSTTITVVSATINNQVVTITAVGLNDWGTAKTEFRHDLEGSIDATLTVNGFISADNIDPSGLTVGHNEAMTVQYSGTKHNILMRRYANGSIGGKDLFLHAGNLDADLHLATFHDTGTSATDNAKIRMTIGDSKTGGGAYSSFIDMFEDVTIKDAKDFEMFDATETPVKKFSIDGATGNTAIVGTLDVTGNLDVNSKFAVTASTGAVAHSGGLTINTDKFAVTDAGAVSYVGDLAINTDKFNVAGSDGDTSIAGTLGVAEATSLSKTLEVTGISTLAIVDIAGGENSAIDDTAIGATSPFTGKFTTLESTGLATLDSLEVTAGATVGGTLGVTGATTLSSTLSVAGKTSLNATEVQSDLAVDSRLTVGYPYEYLARQRPPISTVLDVRKETKFALANARDSELRPIVATFSKKDLNSDNSPVDDRGHKGSIRVLFTPQPYTMTTSKTQTYEDSNNVVLDWIDATSVTIDYQTTSAMANYTMPVVGDTITVGSDTLTIDDVSISGDTVDITHDDSVTDFGDTKEFSHAYLEGHPITISGNTSNYNVAEIEVNTVASTSDLFGGSKEGDLLFKNHFTSEAGTGGYMQFYTAKPLIKTGTESQNTIEPSMIIGAGDTHGQLGVGMAPISGLGGSVPTDDLDTRGATLALKGKLAESYLKEKIEVPASIYFEDAEGVNKATITLNKNGKLEIPAQGSPVETPFAVGTNAVEIGKDLVPYLYDHTGIEETQENSGTTKDLFFSNLDEYETSGGNVDFIVDGVFLKIYKHDDANQTTFVKRKVTNVDTETKIVTIDTEIPSTYDFQTIYPTTASDYPNATQVGSGSSGHHVIKIGELGSVYSGTTTVVFQIEIGSNNDDLSASQYQWRKNINGGGWGDWYIRSYNNSTPTTQDLGEFVGSETAILNPEKDWYGVKVQISQTNTATAETFEFATRLPSKVEVYKDVDLGTTDNAFDDIYAKGFAMKGITTAPTSNHSDGYGKLWIDSDDGFLYFQNPTNGNNQQISDLSNNFSSVNVDLVPSLDDTYNIGDDGTASAYTDRKTFKDFYYSGHIKRWNGVDGYTTIGETSVSPPTKHAIQVNANSNTYIINDNTAPFSIIEEEFDNTIKESYLDLKFGWTPTGGEVVEDAYAGTEFGQSISNHSTLDTDLVSYFEMDNNWNDSKGSNNLTASGATFDSSNKKSYSTHSGSFDGVNDYARRANTFEFTSSFSVSFWTKPDDAETNTWWRFVDNYAGGSEVAGWHVARDSANDKVRFQGWATDGSGSGSQNNGVFDISSSSAIDFDGSTWYHISCVYDKPNDKAYIYIDGVEVASGDTQGNICYNSSVEYFTVGARTNNSTNTENLKGIIDELGVWEKPLSSSEVGSLYNGGNGLAYSDGPSGSGSITVGSNTDTHFSDNPETTTLSTSLLVPMDFDSWRDNDVRFKVKVNNTTDTEIKVDIYDTAQNQVGTTQTLTTGTTWTDVALNEFVPGSGTPEWTRGDSFSLHITTKLKKTSASVQLSTLRFQYNTQSYSTSNVPLPHITSTSSETEIDQQLAVGGDILPTTDGDKNLGSASKKWNQLNAVDIHTHDLHLNNESSSGNEVDGTTGNWTVQEGEEDLFIINRKSGKKFKFKLEEIE